MGSKLTNMMFTDKIHAKISNRGKWDMKWYPFDDRIVEIEVMNFAAFTSFTTIEPLRIPTAEELTPLCKNPSKVRSQFWGQGMPSYSDRFYSRITQLTESIKGKIPGAWLPQEGHDHVSVKVDRATVLGRSEELARLKLQLRIKRSSAGVLQQAMMPITLCSIAAYFGLYVPITVAM